MSEYIVQAADWAIDYKGESLFKGCEEIVRCGNCKHLNDVRKCPCGFWALENLNGFCAWGERDDGQTE